MLRVGVTGGIGCGKTTVAGLFAELGVPVIDADQVARDVVRPGEPALAALVAHFGPDILVHGQLDRSRLREHVFASETERRWLEQLLHPRVYEAMERQVQSLDSPYCLLVVPLLLETGRRDFVDRLLVVDCSEATQAERVRARDGMTPAMLERIRAAQMSRQLRVQAADDVLVNEGDLEALRGQVEALHRQYRALADCP